MKLTIAIPTFDRNDALSSTVAALLPQLTEQCELLIIDNCSPTPVSETLHDLVKDLDRHGRIKIIRNRANIGLGANLIRCHELCETEYVWTLSDDDILRPDAIQTILAHISRYPDCVYFHYCCKNLWQRPATFLTRGLDEFVELSEDLRMLFCSANVYKNNAMLPFVNVGYHFAYSLAGFLAMLMMALKSTHASCCFSEAEIVTMDLSRARWSGITLALGLRTLLELPVGARSRKLLWRKVRSVLASVNALVLELLALAEKEHDPHLGLYLFDQIMSFLVYFSWSPLLWAQKVLYRIFFIRPRFSLKWLLLLYKATKKKDRLVQERFTRE